MQLARGDREFRNDSQARGALSRFLRNRAAIVLNCGVTLGYFVITRARYFRVRLDLFLFSVEIKFIREAAYCVHHQNALWAGLIENLIRAQ